MRKFLTLLGGLVALAPAASVISCSKLTSSKILKDKDYELENGDVWMYETVALDVYIPENIKAKNIKTFDDVNVDYKPGNNPFGGLETTHKGETGYWLQLEGVDGRLTGNEGTKLLSVKPVNDKDLDKIGKTNIKPSEAKDVLINYWFRFKINISKYGNQQIELNGSLQYYIGSNTNDDNLAVKHGANAYYINTPSVGKVAH